ncbi:aldolase [Thozetella sp. PMI_491]|nr:aldolase [Thozetella sp. PMI_491]
MAAETTSPKVSWLDKLQEQLYIDADTLDEDFIKGMAPKYKFHDQTSNQLWVDDELAKESNAPLLRQVVTELKDQDWLASYTRVSVLLCKRTIDDISGRVLLQTLPSQAYNTEATLAHARLYDAEFQRAGIPRDRFCIKIPSTGPGLNAAKILQQEGIQTLGTALFGVPQAVACSQARTLYISPYYGEETTNVGLVDPATQHTNSPRQIQILETYKKLYKETGQEQPLVKNASVWSPEEAMAVGEMGCHSVTIFPSLLKELSELPYDPEDKASKRPLPFLGAKQLAHVYRDAVALAGRLLPLSLTDPFNKDDKPVDIDAAIKVDYLADGGKALDEAIAADAEAARRVKAALEWFIKREQDSKKRIEDILATL